jgi:nucleotide-binding universal stress UspA family protein
MKTILSPTRGGEKSYPNQDFAIQLAKELEAKLVFLYVSDVQFINQISSPVLIDVAAELEEMGGFLLAMAQERANKSDIDADIVVRSGDFREIVESLISQYDIDILVLGSSDEGSGNTSNDYMENLSQELADTHDIKVLLARNGQLLKEKKAQNS